MTEYYEAPFIRIPKFMRKLYKEDPECHKIIQDWFNIATQHFENIRKIVFDNGKIEFDFPYNKDCYDKLHAFNELYQSKKDEYYTDDIEFTILYIRNNNGIDSKERYTCVIAYTILLPEKDDNDTVLRFSGYILEDNNIKDYLDNIVKLYTKEPDGTDSRKTEFLNILDNINTIIKSKQP